MLPIWLLYFMPLFIVPNYLLKLGMAGIAVYIAHKCIFRLHIPARSALECWGLAILAELMGLSVFFVLERMLPAAFYDRHDALWGALALLLICCGTLPLRFTRSTQGRVDCWLPCW